MGRQDIFIMYFSCDWKCGATAEVNDRNQLNHAHVPTGWERIAKEWSSVGHTNEHEGTPYILCPTCFRLFEIAAMGESTPTGMRFRSYVASFWAAEAQLIEATVSRETK